MEREGGRERETEEREEGESGGKEQLLRRLTQAPNVILSALFLPANVNSPPSLPHFVQGPPPICQRVSADGRIATVESDLRKPEADGQQLAHFLLVLLYVFVLLIIPRSCFLAAVQSRWSLWLPFDPVHRRRHSPATARRSLGRRTRGCRRSEQSSRQRQATPRDLRLRGVVSAQTHGRAGIRGVCQRSASGS